VLRVSCSWPTRARAAGRPGPPALHPPSLSPSSLDSTLARTITTTKQNRFANQHHFPPQNLNCVRGLPSRVITLERAVAPQFPPQVFHVWYGMVGCRQMLPITAATLAEQAVSGGQKPSRSCESATSSCLCRRPAIPSSPARPSPMLRCPFPPISSLGSNWPACPWHRTSHPQSLHVNEPVSPNARLSTCPMQRGQAKSQALSGRRYQTGTQAAHHQQRVRRGTSCVTVQRTTAWCGQRPRALVCLPSADFSPGSPASRTVDR